MEEWQIQSASSIISKAFEVKEYVAAPKAVRYEIASGNLREDFPETFMVAELDSRDVGYVMCKCEHGFSNFKKLGFVKKCHLVSIAVLEEHRGKGMGSAMLVGVIEGARTYKCTELYLEVRCSNNEAVRLYQKMNFQIRNRLGSYYRDGEDAYLMSIELCE